MSEVTESNIPSKDDERLERTQEIREKIISVLAGEPLDLSANAKDKDHAKTLLTVMKDMDDQILKRKKLMVDEKNTETNAAMIAAIAREMSVNSARQNGTSDHLSTDNETGTVPVPDESRFHGAEPAKNEMVQEENNTDIDSFMAIHGKQARVSDEERYNIPVNG